MTPAINLAIPLGDNRISDRTPLGRSGVMRLADGGEPIAVVVLDLSREGCRIQGDSSVEPGMRTEVGLANIGRITATVTWRGTNSFGCVFDRPLPPGAITAALGPSNVVALPLDAMAAVPLRPINKLGPNARLLVIGAACVVTWVPVALMAMAFA